MDNVKVLVQKCLRIFGMEPYRRANILGFGLRKALSASGYKSSRNIIY